MADVHEIILAGGRQISAPAKYEARQKRIQFDKFIAPEPVPRVSS